VWNNATKRWEGECPVCSYYSYLWKQSEGKGEEEQKALQAKARAIKPVERYYYSVIQRTVVDESGKTSTNVGPLILSIGKQLHQFILKSMVGDAALEEKGFGDVTDPKLGRDFKIIKKIKKSGDESYPEYNDSRFLEPSPLGTPDEVAKWTEAAFDLATLRKVRPVEELKHQLKVHLGLEKEVGKDNFDPSEYTPVYGGADVVKPAATVAPVATATAKAPVAVDEPMADDDFLTKLREQGLSSEE
jgi:hypothetical protein